MDSVLSWKQQKERAIPHLVLGRNLPGGAWHVSVILEPPILPYTSFSSPVSSPASCPNPGEGHYLSGLGLRTPFSAVH